MKITKKKQVEIPTGETTMVEPNFTPIKMSKDTKLFDKAMKQVKETGEKILSFGDKEKIKNRLRYGMDEAGHPIKVVETDPETGLVIKKKRGRKPKVKVELEPSAKGLIVLGVKPIKTGKSIKVEKPVKVVKPVKVKIAKKKEKSGVKGRVAALPVLRFNGENKAQKLVLFDKTINELIGKYDGKILVYNGEKISLVREVSESKKNKDGVLHVIATKNGTTQKLSSYEWDGRFYPARVLNYAQSVVTKK